MHAVAQPGAVLAALIARHQRAGDLSVQVRIFTRALGHSAPAGVARDVEHGREGEHHARAGGLLGGDLRRLMDQIGVKRAAPPQRDGEHGLEAVDYVLAEQQRDAQAALFHRELLPFARLRSVIVDINDAADQALLDLAFQRQRIHVPADGGGIVARGLHHLADLLLQRHAGEQFFHTFFDFFLRSHIEHAPFALDKAGARVYTVPDVQHLSYTIYGGNVYMENHPFKIDIDYIQPGVVHFEDNIDSSFYLIEGRDKALLIDTGCGGGNIHRLASAFTDKPIELAVTHDHGDHDAHAMEFSKVYMHRADIDGMREKQERFRIPENERLDPAHFTPVEDGSVIPLGDSVVRVLHIPGHTAGSVVFVDEGRKVVFTGDAIGSGVGVWMQLPGCSSVDEYRLALKHLLTELYPYRNYLYLGGHFRQGGTPGTASYNPVTYRMAEDMTTLCDRMLSGSAEDALYDSDKSFGPERAHIATYGTASMVYLPSQVH